MRPLRESQTCMCVACACACGSVRVGGWVDGWIVGCAHRYMKSVLQCVAVCCSVLRCVVVCG